MTTVSPRKIRLILIVTLGALVFQLGHFAEHTAQMLQWVLHPQRGPWMSTWANDLALNLGQIDPARASETTTAMQRGVELLHLVGNAIFLVGSAGLLFLLAPGSKARSWARATFVVQALHTAEHVALTLTILFGGRAIGISTGFGAFDGTRLSTYRVWWHGLVNFLATVLAVVAVLVWRESTSESFKRRLSRWLGRLNPASGRALVVPGFGVLLLPLIAAFAIGNPISDGPASRVAMGAAPVDNERSGDLGSGDLRLVDVAADIGLDVQHSAFRWDVTMDPIAMMGAGVCWIDVDQDGWLDLFLTDTWADGEWNLWNAGSSLPTTRIFRNVGGVFEEYTEQWGAGFETRANGCVAADFDGDGFTDLYVTSSRANLLLWNDSGTGFIEGGEEAEVDAYGWHTGVAAGDINGDGLVDIVVAGYVDLNRTQPDSSMGFPNNFAPIGDVVLLNRGASGNTRPVFETVEAGLEPDGPEYGLGVVLIDVDSDGDLDLYVANDTQKNRLYLNETSDGSTLRFVDVSEASGADDPKSGMGIATGDINGDRLPDLVVTNFAGQGHAGLLSGGIGAPLYEPEMDGVADIGYTQTGWGASFGDLDLDGDLDLLLASGQIPMDSLESASEPLTYLSNEGFSEFINASKIVGLERLDDRNGRAVAFADYDNDGDLDAVVSAIGQSLLLLQNRGSQGHWLMIDAGGPVPGMSVRLEFADGLVVQRVAIAGGSWLSSEDPRLHFGLGSHEKIQLVIVTWPDGQIQRFENVEADQIFRPRAMAEQ